MTKIKAIWIGSMNKSICRLCREFELDWDQKLTKTLEMTFTSDIVNIWQHNVPDSLHKVERNLEVWTKKEDHTAGKNNNNSFVKVCPFIFYPYTYLTHLVFETDIESNVS